MKNEADIRLDANLKILAERNPALVEKLKNTPPAPDLELVLSKTGRPVLVRKGLSLHSRHDPLGEAEKFAASRAVEKAREIDQDVVVFGLGLGYHIRALAAKFRNIHVVEPSLAVLKLALSLGEWQDILCRVFFITDQDDFPLIPIGPTLLVHRPAERLEPGFCSKINLFLQERSVPRLKTDSARKILVVGPFFGGSLPVARHTVRALNLMGHHVIDLDLAALDPFYQTLRRLEASTDKKNDAFKRLIHFISDYLTLLVETEKPDLVLALAQAPLDPHTLARIRNLGCPSAFWFVEDGRFLTYYREFAGGYDYFFHIQGAEMEAELKKLGVKNFLNLPLAADPEVFQPIADQRLLAPFRADLSFMGAGYPNRRAVFPELLDFDFKIWGTEWDLESDLGRRVQKNGARVSTAETVLIYNAGRINLNLHSSIFTAGLDAAGGFINPRTFEIAACGAFQLVDRRHPLQQFFEPEKELSTFENVAELRDKIAFFLQRPELREEMGRAARKRVLAEHTYQHRLKVLLDFVENKS
ncbi:MAG: glycosyltransferase [Pseudomonadota bacterium]